MSVPEITIPEHILKAGPWSVSKAGVIEKCSLQFDYQYGPQKRKSLLTFTDNRVGICVHKALELALKGNSTKVAFDHAEIESELTSGEREALYATWDQVDRFVKWVNSFSKLHTVTERLIEVKWAISPNFGNTVFFDRNGFFRGVVDLGLLTAKNDLIIIDHKSGKQKDKASYDVQFDAYAVMAVSKYPRLRGIQTAINFTATDQQVWKSNSGESLWDSYVTRKQIIEEVRPRLVRYLTRACEGLLTDPVAKEGWWCAWCGFKPLCPAFASTSESGGS